MSSGHIPADVWTAISDHVVHPKLHITLSQICTSSRSIYEDEDKWKLLCRSIGVGRGTVEKKDTGWKQKFVEVVMHRERCKLPQCYQFGLPPLSTVGDLLPSPEATQQHQEYLKTSRPCKCGKPFGHSDAHNPPEGTDVLPDEDPHAPGVQVDAMTALFGQLLGAAPLSASQYQQIFNVPLPALGAPIIPAAPPAPQTGDETAETAPQFPPDDVLPQTAAITPHLLPLSYKNRKNVPRQPVLHPFLAETGGVQFQRWLAGQTVLLPIQPYSAADELSGKLEGVDWDVEDERSTEWTGRNFVPLDGHHMLLRAFA